MANRKTNSRGKGKSTSRPGKNRSYDKSAKSASKDNISKVQKAEDATAAPNDPGWYATNPQLLKDAASLTFSNMLGLPVGLAPDGDQAVDTVAISDDARYIPGIMRITFRPSIGISDSNVSAINVAGRNLYANVRYANSGKTNYEHPDLIQYVVGASQMYAYIAFLMRVYGVCNVYNGTNRYVPEALVKSMNIDFDDIIHNLADFRFHIKYLIDRVSSTLWIPATMPLLARWFWMNSNIYADAENPKSQLYYYHQEGYWKYSGIYSKTGGGLEYVKPVSSDTQLRSYRQLIDFAEELLQPLVSSEDVGVMAGDLLKAFGANRIFTLSSIDDNYVVIPQYNEEVLMQIANSVALPLDMNKDKSWDIRQSDSLIEFAPYTETADAIIRAATARKFLDLRGRENTPENVMVATRLIPVVRTTMTGTAANGEAFLTSSGSEVVMSYEIFTLKGSDLTHRRFRSYLHANNAANLKTVADASKFKFAPVIHLFNPSTKSLDGIIAELDNFTTVGGYELSKMHDTAVLSEFGVPYTVTGN